ncbi:60S acidic ribosomal protein P2 [Blastocladiella emersonii ATCC 22665]|nr:60S acidic ribosomal protein P2 [Blastocladiella emersonii ATCC 22665]
MATVVQPILLPPHAVTLQRLSLPHFRGYEGAKLNREITVPPRVDITHRVLRSLSVRRAGEPLRPVEDDVDGDDAHVLRRNKSLILGHAPRSAGAIPLPAHNLNRSSRIIGPPSPSLLGPLDSALGASEIAGTPVVGRSRANTADDDYLVDGDGDGDDYFASTASLQAQAAAAALAAKVPGTQHSTADDLTGNSILSVVQLLAEDHGVNKRQYSKCLISHAFVGTAKFIVEDRRLSWCTQPLVVTPEIARYVDAPVNVNVSPPPEPWDIHVDHLLPDDMTYPYEISVEVPQSAVYRTCLDCRGTRLMACPTCHGLPAVCGGCNGRGVDAAGVRCAACHRRTSRVVCVTCQNAQQVACDVCCGLGYLRVFLLLRCIWNITSVKVIDTNGYPLTETMLRMCRPLLSVDDIHDPALAALPHPLPTDLAAFFKFLNIQIRGIVRESQVIRHFQCRTSVYPIVEAIYVERPAFWPLARAKRRRWLVVGSSRDGRDRMVIKVKSNRHVAPWLTYERGVATAHVTQTAWRQRNADPRSPPDQLGRRGALSSAPYSPARLSRLKLLRNLSPPLPPVPFFTMKHIAAYLLAVLGGNAAPSVADITAILSSVGIDADVEQLEKVVSELAGKSVEDVIAEGQTKLASVPAGGAAVAAAGAPAAGGAAAPAAAEAEPEPESEEDDDMGFGLFD